MKMTSKVKMTSNEEDLENENDVSGLSLHNTKNENSKIENVLTKK